MGAGMQNAADNIQTLQNLRQAHRAAIFRDFDAGNSGSWNRKESCNRK
jgi:hypothetical protein